MLYFIKIASANFPESSFYWNDGAPYHSLCECLHQLYTVNLLILESGFELEASIDTIENDRV